MCGFADFILFEGVARVEGCRQSQFPVGKSFCVFAEFDGVASD
jgi:hypothetical protein